MNRRHKTMYMLGGLAALVVALLLVWCPPIICRTLNIHTYTLSSLSDFRQFAADEEAFYSAHHTRAVRIDCATLRDEVVAALVTGRLRFAAGATDNPQRSEGGPGAIEAWHQGRLLHLRNNAVVTNDEQQAWATTVRAAIAAQQGQDLAFLPRLFGGVVLHVSHKQIPIVLFSDRPCL